MEVTITITDKGVSTAHAVTLTTSAAVPDTTPVVPTGHAAMAAGGAISAGPAPTALAAPGTGVPAAFISEAGELPDVTADAKSAGPAPKF